MPLVVDVSSVLLFPPFLTSMLLLAFLLLLGSLLFGTLTTDADIPAVVVVLL